MPFRGEINVGVSTVGGGGMTGYPTYQPESDGVWAAGERLVKIGAYSWSVVPQKRKWAAEILYRFRRSVSRA